MKLQDVCCIECRLSAFFACTNILLMAALGNIVVVCIYESRMWRKKEVESSRSKDKRGGNNEFSNRSHLSEFSRICC